jgi:hypothetical protein
MIDHDMYFRIFGRPPYESKYGLHNGTEPLCGWEWIRVHEHDLDGWTPSIELISPGSHFKFTVKDREAMKAVSRIIREK